MSDLTHMPPRHPDLTDEEYRAVCERAAERARKRTENSEPQPQQYAEPTDPYAEDADPAGEKRSAEPEGTTEPGASRQGASNGPVREFVEPVHPYAEPSDPAQRQRQHAGRSAFITVNSDGSSKGHMME